LEEEMSQTKIFRGQHDELLKMLSEISEHLNINELSNNADKTRSLLSELVGKLNVHLSMEDKVLYPDLLEHSNERIKSLAMRYIYELGGIMSSVNDFQKKWSSSLKIQQDPRDFVKHINNFFEALKKRIEKENSILYKALDELEEA
jgi:hemerythrin-like domain-containing protein